jgi:hypothetical protein
MATKTKTKKDGNGIVVLPKELTIQKDLSEVKEKIINAIKVSDEIKMECDEPVEVDIAFIQILQATIKEVEENKKKISINFKLSERSEELMKICGFYNLFQNNS